MSEPIFYRSTVSGEVVIALNELSADVAGSAHLERLSANTTDAAVEKHVPVVALDPDQKHISVRVGEVDHPMLEEHYIEWIALVGNDKFSIKYLHPGDTPEAKFGACCAKGSEVYAYCNLHGLWKAAVEF